MLVGKVLNEIGIGIQHQLSHIDRYMFYYSFVALIGFFIHRIKMFGSIEYSVCVREVAECLCCYSGGLVEVVWEKHIYPLRYYTCVSAERASFTHNAQCGSSHEPDTRDIRTFL